MINKHLSLWLFVASILASTQVGASEFPRPELTPYGAIKAGNQAGTIGEWIGDRDQVAKISERIPKEKPQFKIDASNYAKHLDMLPKGLQSLLEAYPDTFFMNVYPSYRISYFPDWVYDAIEKNNSSVSLKDDGYTLMNTYPGIPFPMPKSGAEVVWNHLLAYKGVTLNVEFLEATVHPGGGSNIITNKLKLSFSYYDKNREASSEKQPYVYYFSQVTSPPKLAGSALLVHENLNAFKFPRQAWGYFASERKVMRLPGVDYDSPMLGSEAIRFADEIDLYNGSIDRYDWKLLGKKEVLIPYNNIALLDELGADPEIIDKLLKPNHISPELLRYELHRVWVVEGTLRKGKSHPYRKRVFYMDEDSWLILLAENYDRNNKLWRVSVSYPKMNMDFPAIFKVADTFHDLRDQAYYVQTLRPGTAETYKVGEELTPKREFKPNVLRRMAR